MLNLLLKDLIIQKKSFSFSLVYTILMLFAFQSLASTGVSSVMIAIGIAYIFLMTAAAYDEKNKSEVILNSLPLKREEIVLAKYLSIFVYIAIGIVFTELVSLVFKFTNLPVRVSLIGIEQVAGILFAVILMGAIFFPLLFKFGLIKIRLVNMFIFLFIFFLPGFLAGYLKHTDKALAMGIIHTLNSLPDWLIGAVFVLIALVIMLLSLKISLKIYRNKDF